MKTLTDTTPTPTNTPFAIGDKVRVRYAPVADKRFKWVEGVVIAPPADFIAWWGDHFNDPAATRIVIDGPDGMFGANLAHPSVIIERR